MEDSGNSILKLTPKKLAIAGLIVVLIVGIILAAVFIPIAVQSSSNSGNSGNFDPDTSPTAQNLYIVYKDASAILSATDCSYNYAFNWASVNAGDREPVSLDLSSNSNFILDSGGSTSLAFMNNISTVTITVQQSFFTFQRDFTFYTAILAGTYNITVSSAYYGCLSGLGETFTVRVMKVKAGSDLTKALTISEQLGDAVTVTNAGASQGTFPAITRQVDLEANDNIWFKLESTKVKILYKPTVKFERLASE